MLLALAVLSLLFTGLTWTKQNPTGNDAGRQVAEQILRDFGHDANVLIVGRAHQEDVSFAQAARQLLESQGANVLAVVNGEPSDLKTELDRLRENEAPIDALAVNSATSKWLVYNSYPEAGKEKHVLPRPYYWPTFLKLSNLIGIANQTAIYAIIAIGMTLVIITAGIDLSVGSLVALSAICCSLFIRAWGGTEAGVETVVGGCLIGVGTAGLAGLFNGVMITAFRLPPFIVTLAMMMMASGLAFRLSNGRSIPELPQTFFWLGAEKTQGIPHPVILMLILYGLAFVVTTWMVFGRYVYAIGGNEEAARLSGVPIKRTLIAVYAISGALAGVGGVLLASQLAAGDPKFGLMYELDVIAAVVVGGTSLMGGRGKILGTLIGAFVIAVIKNGMNLTNVDPFNQKIVLGAVLLAAVLLDRMRRG